MLGGIIGSVWLGFVCKWFVTRNTFLQFLGQNTITILAVHEPIKRIMCISLCDQSVRLFIAGRHFDSFDLVLDALGYVSAIMIVSICRGIYRLVVNRK